MAGDRGSCAWMPPRKWQDREDPCPFPPSRPLVAIHLFLLLLLFFFIRLFLHLGSWETQKDPGIPLRLPVL